jgi:cytochrome c-type biogenesis protein CcmH/NrfF
MSRLALVAATLFLTASATATMQDPEPTQRNPTAQPEPTTGGTIRATELDRQVKEVASQLRCVVCQGLSIQDSPSSLAQEMRALVREQLADGRSPDEVKAYFVERYGEWVLLRPAPRGLNLLVYVLPVGMILGGAVFVFVKARQWTADKTYNESGSGSGSVTGER